MTPETDGILQVGEVPVISRRQSDVETNHDEARRGGRDSALREVLAYVDEREASAPPYTDIRSYTDLRVFLQDLIRSN